MIFAVFLAAAAWIAARSADAAAGPAVRPGMLEWAEIAVIVSLAAAFAFRLESAAAAGKGGKRGRDWFPWFLLAVFAFALPSLQLAAWVPARATAVILAPLLVLPVLLRRVSPAARPGARLFTTEALCRARDAAMASPIISDFRERYPASTLYLYKNRRPHSAGGILLHNSEPIPLEAPTNIDVTLDCPFTRNAGVLAEGKENFHAYLVRHTPRGSIVQPLPQENWDDWLRGLTERDWLKRIEQLDARRPTHPRLERLPCQFAEKELQWQVLNMI